MEYAGSRFRVKVVEVCELLSGNSLAQSILKTQTFLPEEYSREESQKLVRPVIDAQGLLNKAVALLACLQYREPFIKGDVTARQKLDEVSITFY